MTTPTTTNGVPNPNYWRGVLVSADKFTGTDRALLIFDGVNGYMTATNSGNWGFDWVKFVTAEPPQEFDLPLASGFTNADVGIKSRYSKDQMGQVFVDLAVSGSINANTSTTIAMLPEGFRPSYIAHSVAYRYTGQLPSIGFWVSVDGTVSCFSPENIEGLAGQILFIAAT